MPTIPPVVPRGGLPPYEPWHKGLTVYSIDFADSASRFIKANPNHPARQILEEVVENIKKGSLVLNDWIGVEDYLKQNQSKQ